MQTKPSHNLPVALPALIRQGGAPIFGYEVAVPRPQSPLRPRFGAGGAAGKRLVIPRPMRAKEVGSAEMHRIGYHYIAKTLWESVRKVGLQPYPIHGEDMRMMHPGPLRGVWIWSQDMIGKSHIGAILYQVITKQELCVVKLQVEYSSENILHYNGHQVEVPHTGVGASMYHEGDVGIVNMTPILPDKIKKIGEYDLTELLK